eukprot:3843626-Rhodomonas_salina.2
MPSTEGAYGATSAFRKHWPAAQICTLKKNYRSSATVVRAGAPRNQRQTATCSAQSVPGTRS